MIKFILIPDFKQSTKTVYAYRDRYQPVKMNFSAMGRLPYNSYSDE
jgi:hypothetical protein